MKDDLSEVVDPFLVYPSYIVKCSCIDDNAERTVLSCTYERQCQGCGKCGEAGTT